MKTTTRVTAHVIGVKQSKFNTINYKSILNTAKYLN